MSEIPEIEGIDIPQIGLYVIPPPTSLPTTPHTTRQLDLQKPGFGWVVPSYEPMQWNLKEMEIIPFNPGTPEPPPDTPSSEVAEVNTEDADNLLCPGPDNLRVGDIRNTAAKEKVVGHELNDGKCIEIYAPTTFVDKYLPSPSTAATTFGITIVATTAATLAPSLLNKVLKPAFKQIIKRVQKLFGKKTTKPTLQNIRTNAYREKRSLPPLK